MTPPPEPKGDLEGARLVIGVLYNGPWDRLAGWLLAIDPATNEIRREVKDDSLRGWLAARCDRRHQAWLDRKARAWLGPAGRPPHRRWQRT